MPKPTIINAPLPGKNVDFFLRIHRHLPDAYCGESPLGDCNYRVDHVAINHMNAPLVELRKDPEFVKKEAEVRAAVESQRRKMDRTKVKSSNIKAVGYDAETETLEVEFKSGGVYQYNGVPAKAHKAFMGAESKGKYFHRKIKNDYSFKKVS